jgi:hypothetical protein
MKTYRGSRERGKVWIESAEYEGGWGDLPLRLDVFNQHADCPIMPTTCGRQWLEELAVVSRVGIIRGLPESPTACHRGGIVRV